jgi:hypothetical protein
VKSEISNKMNDERLSSILVQRTSYIFQERYVIICTKTEREGSKGSPSGLEKKR